MYEHSIFWANEKQIYDGMYTIMYSIPPMEHTTKEWLDHIDRTYGTTTEAVQILDGLKTDVEHTIERINEMNRFIRTALEEIVTLRDVWNADQQWIFNHAIYNRAALDPILFGGGEETIYTKKEWEIYRGKLKNLLVARALHMHYSQKNVHTFPHVFTQFENWPDQEETRKRIFTHIVCAHETIEELQLLIDKKKVVKLPGMREFLEKKHELTTEIHT